jgi:hypothetical protein
MSLASYLWVDDSGCVASTGMFSREMRRRPPVERQRRLRRLVASTGACRRPYPRGWQGSVGWRLGRGGCSGAHLPHI